MSGRCISGRPLTPVAVRATEPIQGGNVKPARLDVIGTLDNRIGVNQSRVLLARDLNDIGLIYELNALWRVLVMRADLHSWIATLTLSDREHARSIAVRYSPFPSGEPEPEREPACERAPDVFAALRALKRQPA